VVRFPELVEYLRLSWRVERLLNHARDQRQGLLTERGSPREPPWVGEYAWSNGRSSTQIDLGGRAFVLERSACGGTREVAFGEVKTVDGAFLSLVFEERLVLDAPLAGGGRRPFAIERDVFVVPWSGESYLVPAELMVEFCELVHADGREAMEYAGYPRLMSPGQSPLGPGPDLIGLPDVPEEFRRYLPE
jgi:hypothetical protein